MYMYNFSKFLIILFLVYVIYLSSQYVNIEPLVSVTYKAKRPYNRGRGYADIESSAPLAYEKMGNVIKNVNNLKNKSKDEIRDMSNDLYDTTYNVSMFNNEANDMFYSDERIYDDMMYFNSASNTLSNFNHNFKENGGYY